MLNNRRSNDSGRLLVVDDNKVNRLLLGRGLEGRGHQVAFAKDGREALDMLLKQPFDLVLLDIMMPVLDGYQVLAELTSDKDLRNIPVIMTSAMDEIDSVAKCTAQCAHQRQPREETPARSTARVNQ